MDTLYFILIGLVIALALVSISPRKYPGFAIIGAIVGAFIGYHIAASANHYQQKWEREKEQRRQAEKELAKEVRYQAIRSARNPKSLTQNQP